MSYTPGLPTRRLTLDLNLAPVGLTGAEQSLGITPIVLSEDNFPDGSVLDIEGTMVLDQLFAFGGLTTLSPLWAVNGASGSLVSDGLILVNDDEVTPPVSFDLRVVRQGASLWAVRGGFFKNGTIIPPSNRSISQNSIIAVADIGPLPATLTLVGTTTTPGDGPEIRVTSLYSQVSSPLST